MSRIFKNPFAYAGDKVEIAELSQPDGRISIEDGWTPDYELPNDDPNYKPVERDEMNGLFNEVTAALGEMQLNGFAVWRSIAGGWPEGALVSHQGAVWKSTAGGNNTEPGSGASWERVLANVSLGEAKGFASVQDFVESAPKEDSVNIISYYGGWEGTVEGPRGGFTAHKTGHTADNPSVGNPVAPSTIGTGEQAGLFWTADGVEWIISDSRINVLQFGARGDGITDDTAAIQDAIKFASLSAAGATGDVVYMPKGTYLISSRIMLPNRVGIQGSNGRGTVIKPHSTFADDYMFHSENGTSSMFGSWLKDMYIDARGKDMIAPVYSQAWQETCGMERVAIHFDGETRAGFVYENGYGGAAYLPLKDIEIFSDSSHPSARGIWVKEISPLGGFLLSVDGCTIAGSEENPLPVGIYMENDSLLCKGYHIEYMDAGIGIDGAGALSVDSMTGSFNDVVDMVVIGGTFTGRVNLRNIIPNGATGQTFRNNITGKNIAAAEGMLSEYTYENSGFSAYVSELIPNVTGNGYEYVIVYDTKSYDYRSEYNSSTGVFTAKRAGKYLFTASVKVIIPTEVTTFVVKLATTDQEFHLFRGDTDNIRDGSGSVTISGAFVADLSAGGTARVTIIATGLGSNTVSVDASESYFQGHWLTR